MTDRLIGIGLRIYIGLAFLFIFAPIVSLVVFAFNEDRFPSLPWEGFSTRWFDAVLSDSSIIASFKNSIYVGLIVAAIATFLGGTAGYFLDRWDFRGKGAYLGIAVLPPCTPLIILALALLLFLREINLSGSLMSVVISHVVLASAFALGIVRMRLTEMDASLEEAAWNLGASQWRTIREVVLPQAAPAMLAAFLITMAVSWDEFIIAWFVSGLDETLPVNIFNTLQAQVSAEINAIGTIVFGITITLVLLAQFVLFAYGRSGRRRARAEEKAAERVVAGEEALARGA